MSRPACSEDHEYTDAETGFVYLRARYYDPATGQFISRDPLVALTGSAYGSLWGPVGFPIWLIVMVTVSGLAVYMAKRTERIYAERTGHNGSPVFSALLNGVRGGDLTLSPTGLAFERTRRPSTSVRTEWRAVDRIILRKKGPYGSAGILTVERGGQSPPLLLEVADSRRLLSALHDLPEAEGKLESDL